MRTFQVQIPAWGGMAAAVVNFKLFPSGAEDLRIVRRVDELAAEAAPETGPRAASDLQRALEQVSQRIRARCDAALWETGRPPDNEITDADRAAWNARWADDPETPYYFHVHGMLEHLGVLAAWPVLAVGAVPTAYADLATAEIPRDLRVAVAQAFVRARSEAEEAVGKPKPSGT